MNEACTESVLAIAAHLFNRARRPPEFACRFNRKDGLRDTARERPACTRSAPSGAVAAEWSEC